MRMAYSRLGMIRMMIGWSGSSTGKTRWSSLWQTTLRNAEPSHSCRQHSIMYFRSSIFLLQKSMTIPRKKGPRPAALAGSSMRWKRMPANRFL